MSQAAALSQSFAVLDQYFETFNHNAFADTAALFAPAGEMHSPFDSPVVGHEQIAAYLHEEANSMTAHPNDYQVTTLDDGRELVIVTGHVQMVQFRVGVQWRFTMTLDCEIEKVEVKLLASMKELLSLRSSS